ncbi:hypothetical protein I5M32_05870 [Pedobacter sp. SD-b]|uniref:Uncharacterized protein n=1 Tax=Pedobacter segetis TaxID=2793069 RepID=A0ABS1BHZ4_9SPHI|nr:hypothetical protein [Pedobacter segetis]MBK0382484.1 hypothetical protein [Pedobacter segetis]
MKWGLKLFGILDAITFLIFICPKFNYLISTFKFPFATAIKVAALWENLILLLFLITACFLFLKPKTGLIFSFILIPFKIAFSYYSFDFLSYLAYYMGFQPPVNNHTFQYNWYYFLLITEALRYLYSLYAYYKLSIN